MNIADLQEEVRMRTPIYKHYGSRTFDREKFVPVSNDPETGKPVGGFWASRVTTHYGWREYAREQNEYWQDVRTEKVFLLDDFVRFQLSEDARIVKVYTYKDPENLPIMMDESDREMIDYAACRNSGIDAIETCCYGNGAIDEPENERLRELFSTWHCDQILILNPDVIDVLTAGKISEPGNQPDPTYYALEKPDEQSEPIGIKNSFRINKPVGDVIWGSRMDATYGLKNELEVIGIDMTEKELNEFRFRENASCYRIYCYEDYQKLPKCVNDEGEVMVDYLACMDQGIDAVELCYKGDEWTDNIDDWDLERAMPYWESDAVVVLNPEAIEWCTEVNG